MSTATRSRKPRVTEAPPLTQALPLAPLSRSVKSLTVSFKVVSFAASLHGVAAEQSDPLVTVCEKDHPPVKTGRPDRCPTCKDETDRSAFVKGQVTGDTITVLTREQVDFLKGANEANAKALDLQVVQADETYMVTAGSTYYIAAKGSAVDHRNYALIAAVVRNRPHLAFVAELSFGAAPKLFRLAVTDEGVLMAREIARPEAVRARPEVATQVDTDMLQVIEELVDAAAVPFDPTAFANPHIARVTEALSTAKPVLTATAAPTAVGTSGEDLLTALQASLAALKAPAKPAARRGSRSKAA